VHLRGGVPGAAVAPVLPADEAFLYQIAHHLLDEERVALGLAVIALGRGDGDLLAADVRHHAVDFVHG